MRELFVWLALYYLRFFARIALFLHRPYVIGIAGSVGKSSTRNALFSVLKNRFNSKVVSGNSETGIPLGILGIKTTGFAKKNWLKVFFKAPFKIFNLRHCQYLIVEMGIDDPYPPKNMSYLLTIIKPDMAIDLNATATHTEQFEKILKKHTKDSLSFIVEKIAEEDSKIITNGYTKVGIFNGDDKLLKKSIEKNAQKEIVTLLTFGEESSNSLYYASYSISDRKSKFKYKYRVKNTEKEITLSFDSLLLPPVSRESFAAVLIASQSLGIPYEEAKDYLERNFTLPKGRSSLLEGIRGSFIIDSSYNSSKSTVISLLEMIKNLKEKRKVPVVFVMGDMRELGSGSKQEHEEVARFLLPIVDEVHCVGAQTLEYVVPIVKASLGRKNRPKKVEWYKNAVQAGLHLKDELPKDSIVLVKGSQNTIYLEETVKFLLANPADSKKLTRQDQYWQQVKKSFFSI